jgi:hypothetical protein
MGYVGFSAKKFSRPFRRLMTAPGGEPEILACESVALS